MYQYKSFIEIHVEEIPISMLLIFIIFYLTQLHKQGMSRVLPVDIYAHS